MLNELSESRFAQPAQARRSGPGSGKGKTCGTGVKGQALAAARRSSRGSRVANAPLPARLKGFQNRFRVENEVVNLAALAVFGDNAEVDVQAMVDKGLVRGSGRPVKVLAEGEAPNGLKLKVNKISASAQAQIEAAGGSVETV